MVLCSLTKTAAGVLRGRVPVPQQQVATLHALAYRALGGMPIAETDDLARAWNDQPGIPDSWKIEGYTIEDMPTDAHVGAALAMYSRWRGGLCEDRILGELCKGFAARWEAYKRDTDSVDFTDLLQSVLDLRLPLPYDAAVFVVDEAQDLTPLAHAVADHWGASVRHYLTAGDPAQVLYDFIGASPAPLWEPLPDGHRRVLAQSWRLPSTIHALAEQWLSYHSGAMMTGRDYRPQEDAGLVEWAHLSPEDGEELAERVQGDAEIGTVMLLTSCGYQLRPALAALRAAGVPFHNPLRPSETAWNPLGGATHGVSTVSRVAALVAPQRGGEWNGGEIDLWSALLKKDAFTGPREQFEARPRVTLHELHNFLVPAAVEAIAQDRPGDLEPLIYAKFKKPLDYIGRVVARQGATALKAPPRITVGTIHSVKGGESESVYLLPHLSPSAEKDRLLSGNDAAIRLRYVGMTRSRSVLTVCIGSPKRWGNIPVEPELRALAEPDSSI